MTRLTHITNENIDFIKETLPIDQAKEIEPGCITWFIPQGYITVWPDAERAACSRGGDSVWGRYYGTPGEDDFYIKTDDGVEIDVAGEESE